MTTTLGRGTSAIGLAELSFDRTVDRRLLHRHALAEVFLTDSNRIDERDYLAAARIPPFHTYYRDLPGSAGHLDPLLLLECARQAETYGGHVYFDVPFDTNFILRRWSMSIERPDLLTSDVDELGLAVRTHNARSLAGVLRALTYTIDLVVGAETAGTVHIDVAYLTGEAYQEMRTGRRDGRPPVTSADLTTGAAQQPLPSGRVLAPDRVGRSDPGNVVLYEPLFEARSASARMRVPLRHPSMFDHPQDHLPGMVMMEAARQLGLVVLAADPKIAPASAQLVGLEASFSQYCELDEITVVRAGRPLPATDSGEPVPVRVTFEQQGRTAARATLLFQVPTPAGRRGPEAS